MSDLQQQFCRNPDCQEKAGLGKPFCSKCLNRLPLNLKSQIKRLFEPIENSSRSQHRWIRTEYTAREWLRRSLPTLTNSQYTCLVNVFKAATPVPGSNNVYRKRTVGVLMREDLIQNQGNKIKLTEKGTIAARLLTGDNVWDWEDWIPDSLRSELEQFWSVSFQRSPLDREFSRNYNHAPEDGIYIVTVDLRDRPISGRYVHAFNNMGRLVTDNGEVVVCCCDDKLFKPQNRVETICVS